MKTTRTAGLMKIAFRGILAAGILFLFDSCATKVPFLNSSVVPAARGDVKVKKDKNKNYAIEVNLSNLAEPKRLDPAKQLYVVWMEAGEDNAKNVGQINSSTSLFSKRLKASFSTVSSIKPRKIFITAEDEANTQYPGGQVVLSTDNF